MKQYFLPCFLGMVSLFNLCSVYGEDLSIERFYEERSFDYSPYPIASLREEGFLKVSPLHSIYYATFGNPEGIPVVILHGGPGAGCYQRFCRFFDPTRWNIVMFDQRGAMRSEPFGCMEENTPQHSISDIEALRQHLGVQKWLVVGGSWGSSLALLYGQEHPEHCLGFILRGVFLVREPDYRHLFYEMGKIFPEAYQSVVDLIPENERDDLISAYYRRVCDPNPDVHLPAARTFMTFDATCATHLPSPGFLNSVKDSDKLMLSITRAYCHYAVNRFFLEPNQILNRMDRISHLPAIIIHGRWDAICLPEMAYLLYQAWGNSKLWMIPDGGHADADPSISGATIAATDTFANLIKGQP